MQRIVYVVFVLALLASCGPDLPEDFYKLGIAEYRSRLLYVGGEGPAPAKVWENTLL